MAGEILAQEVRRFNIRVAIIEPGRPPESETQDPAAAMRS
jgi:hypothetical protein